MNPKNHHENPLGLMTGLFLITAQHWKKEVTSSIEVFVFPNAFLLTISQHFLSTPDKYDHPQAQKTNLSCVSAF